MIRRPFSIALRTAIFYAIIAGVWILFSDQALASFISSPQWLTTLQTYKGWAFVGVTALLLYLFLRRQFFDLEHYIIEHQQKEEALRQSEYRYRMLFEQNNDAIFLIGLDQVSLMVNQRAADMFGYRLDELIGMSIQQLIAPEARAQTHNVLNRLLAKEKIPIYERLFVKKDGTRLLAEVNVDMVRDLRGTPLHIQSICHDITERKRSEEAVQESQAQVAGIVASAMDAVISINAEHRIVLFNLAAETMFRCAAAEAIHQPLEKFIPERFRASHPQHIRDFALSGITNRAMGDLRIIVGLRSDGVEFPADASISQIHLASGDLYTVILRDVTKRKQVEEKLRESEERYRQLFENSPIGIYRTTPDGRILASNPALLSMLGFSLFEEVATRNLEKDGSDVTYPRSFFKEQIERDGHITGFETEWRKRDGSLIFVRENAQAIRDETGAVMYYDGTIEDITERKQAEEKLRESEERYRIISNLTSDYAYSFHFEPDGTFTREWTTEAFFKITGYSPTDPQFKNGIGSIVHPDDRHLLEERNRRDAAGEEATAVTHRIVRKDGEIRWLYNFGKSTRDESTGTIVRFCGAVQDITERVQAEEKSRQAYQLLETVFDNTHLMFAYLDPQFNFTRVNRAYAKADEREPLFYIGKNHFDLFPNEENQAIFQRVVDSGEAHFSYAKSFEYVEHPERGVSHWDWSLVPIKDAGGKIVGLILSLLNVTERVRAEARLRRFWDLPLIGMAITSTDRVFLEVNQKFADMMGYAVNELAGIAWPDVTHPDDVAENTRLLQETLAGKIDEYTMEKRFIRRDGTLLQAHIAGRCIRRADGSVDHLALLIQDITERKQHERERDLLDRVRATLARELDLPTILHAVVEAIAETFGYTLVSLYLLRGETLVMQHQVGYSHVINEIPITQGVTGHVVRTRQPVLIKDVHADPTFLGAIEGIVSEVCVPLFDESQVVGALNVESTQGVKLSEADLNLMTVLSEHIGLAIGRARLYTQVRESEERFRNMFAKHSAVMLLIEPLGGEIIEANLAAEKFYGYPISRLCTMNVAEINTLPPDQVAAERQRALREESNYFVFPHRLANGEIRTVEVHSSPITVESHSVLFSIIHDITERVQADEKLRESEERFRSLVETTTDWIWEIDEQGVYRYASPRIRDMLGYEPAEVIGKTPADLMPPEEAQRVTDIFNPIFAARSSFSNLENMNRHKEGRLVALETSGIPFVDKAGKFCGYRGIDRDITQRKQAEESERQHNRQINLLYEASRHLNRTLDLDEIYQAILGFVSSIVSCDSLVISAFDADTRLITCRAMWVDGRKQEVSAFPSIPLEPKGQGTQSVAIRIAHSLLLNDYQARVKTSQSSHYVSQDGVMVDDVPPEADIPRSAMVVPLMLANQVVGVIQVFSYQLNAYTDTQLKILESLASHIASAQQNALLYNERARAEQQAAASEAKLHALFSAMRDVVLTIDKDGIYREIAPTNPGLLIRPPHQLLGKSLTDVFLPLQAEEFLDVTRQVLATQQVKYVEYDLTISGKQVWFSTAITPMSTDATVWVARDITERKRSETHIQQQMDRLSTLRVIDQAISSSFDLRFTLSVILNQVTSQLRADAAVILLLNPQLQTLQYSAGSGFRSKVIERTHLHLGVSYAGRAVLERQTISAPPSAVEHDPRFAALKAAEGFVTYYSTPLITKGNVVGVLEIFHRAPFESDSEWLNFLEMLAGQAAIAVDNANLFQHLQRSNIDLMLAYDTTLEGWSRALDMRDKETEGHSQRVTALTLQLARAMELSEEAILHIRRGALLHDIGKMGVPDSILLKPDKLNDEEWELMRRHPQYALDLLSPIPYLRPALDIPYCHHEKWDGTGYPRGLQGEQIPLAARLFAIADIWDALRSDRPYRPGWSAQKTRDHIKSLSGIHLDPKVVEVFLTQLQL